MFTHLKDLLTNRMTVVFVAGLLMLGAAFLAVDALALPAFFQVALFKGFLLFASAHAGYWIDRLLFPYARPDLASSAHLFALCMIRRAVIVAAAMLCVGLGA